MIDICDIPDELPPTAYITAPGYPEVSPQASSCEVHLNKAATIHEITIFDLDTIAPNKNGNCGSQYLKLQVRLSVISIFNFY